MCICMQSFKIVLIGEKNFFIKIFNMISKNAKFYADFESVEKSFNAQKSSYLKRDGNMEFFHFYSCL
jgi:hypothetical protein